MLHFILMALGRATGRSDADEELMERYREGDVRAFEVLLARHEKKVFHFIYRMVRDQELANDLLQETFLRVVRNADGYTRKARFTTWLYTIARNVSIDALRKASHRRHQSLDAPRGGRDGDGEGRALIEKVAGDSPDGERHAQAEEITRRVRHAVEQLSDEQREVFVMRQFQGMPFKEIAAVVGVSENTAKSRMRYALENLRLALADYAQHLPGGADPVPARSRG